MAAPIRGPLLAAPVAALALALALPLPASAHWCDDNWGTSYNIVVRPETDSVTVPATGAANLNLWVQNNMGYPLQNFALDAEAAGYSVSVSRQAPRVAGYLMPGERLQHTLAISRDGGGTVGVADIDFFVSFGDGSQSRYYGQDPAEPVMVRQADGTLAPARPVPGLGDGNAQALHLRLAAQADYGDLGQGLDGLVQEYCAGRGSWDHNSTSVQTQYCPGPTQTASCPPRITATAGTKYDWQKLWALQEILARKSALGARLPAVRQRLQCAWDDADLPFRAFAAFALGYLGADAGAQSFLAGIASSGDAGDQLVAKAGLLLLGDTSVRADVTGGLSSSDPYVAATCAAALGIADDDDSAVETVLLPRARWIIPDESGHNGEGLFEAHLLAVVAWDRRGWAVDAGDTGRVTFYEGEAPGGNHAPDCSAATVSPGYGPVPLTATLDATGCTDEDGDALTYLWRVPTSVTTEDTYDTATATHTFTEEGLVTVRLVVTDQNASPMQTNRSFTIDVGATSGGGGDAEGGCGCRAATGAGGGAAVGALGLLAAGWLLVGRRRARRGRG